MISRENMCRSIESIFLSKVESRGFHVEGRGYHVEGNFFFNFFFFLNCGVVVVV